MQQEATISGLQTQVVGLQGRLQTVEAGQVHTKARSLLQAKAAECDRVLSTLNRINSHGSNPSK